MERLLGTMFADLHILRVDTNKIIKHLQTQNRTNRLFAIALLLETYCIGCAAAHCLDNKEKIEKLEKEIKELKEAKGE